MTPESVRRTQEGTSNQNRHPEGQPTGGQWAAHAYPEASGVTLADPAGRLIVLAPGEDENFNELADGDVRRELSDAAALAIAGRLKDPSRPALSRFAVRG